MSNQEIKTTIGDDPMTQVRVATAEGRGMKVSISVSFTDIKDSHSSQSFLKLTDEFLTRTAVEEIEARTGADNG